MTARRRLCMVVHGPYPIGEPRVARQARAARDAGYEVDVVSMLRAGEPADERVEGIRVMRLPIEHRRGVSVGSLLREYVGFTLRASLRVARLQLRHRYDVVQIHNPPDFLMLAALAPKILGARVLLDVHDLAPDMFAARFEGRRGAAAADGVLRRLERLAARVADAVLTVHAPYRDELVARGVPAEKITVVMNTVDESLLPTGVEPPRNPERFRIVYHGTVNAWYGVERVVDALAAIVPSLPGAVLEIYGEGDALPGILARAAEIGVLDRVRASGRAHTQREVLEFVRGADVGVIPNLPTRLNRYALSSKLFEYVALGIPVAVSDLPTLRVHFDADEVSFFEAGNSAALAAALLDIATDRAAAGARVERARKRYEGYRWRINGTRYVALLSNPTVPTWSGAQESAA